MERARLVAGRPSGNALIKHPIIMRTLRIRSLAAIAAAITLSGLADASAAELQIRARNSMGVARPSQTIELTAEALAPLGQGDLTLVHILDAAGGEVLCQALDTDFDPYHKPDSVVFQADFEPNAELTFTAVVGKKQIYTKDQFRAYGRFVRERFDDFAWENDRIAHRTYGRGLETWEGEPLSSSTVDVWSKRTPRMVINEWYMTDDYHDDRGEGADLYSAGLTRGCGGSGLWAADRLWVSRAFVDSRVLANGPIRLVFELVYAPFDVNGISVSEVKRITLDAGQQLNHFESRYQPYVRPGRETKLISGAGLKKVNGEQVTLNSEQGWLAKWEKVSGNNGYQGLAVIADPGTFLRQAEDDLNHLILLNVSDEGVASYWAGFCWDKAGVITDFDAWKQYVSERAVGLATPIEITVSEK